MSDSAPPPKPPPVVRLARLAWPANEWFPNGPSSAYTSIAEGTCFGFSLHSLDDLALAESMVIAAGLEHVLVDWIEDALGKKGVNPAFAPARARAAALIRVLDSHPELEQPK